MGKTIIVEIYRGACTVQVYDGNVLRDIEKAIDLEDGLLESHSGISCDEAAEIVRNV